MNLKISDITPYQRFEQAIKSKATKIVYDKYLNDFLKYSDSNPEDFIKLSQKEIEDTIFLYISNLKLREERNEISPNSFNMIISPVKLFLDQNDILLNWAKLKKMFPRKKQTNNQLPYTTDEIIKMLEFTSSPRIKAFTLFMSSTGCRIGAICDLRISDIEEIQDGAIVTMYDGDIEEYRTCLSPESYNSLKEYFDYRNTQGYPVTKDSHIFCDKGNKNPISYDSSRNLLNHVRVKSGIKVKGKKRTKKTKSQNHAFRKRFETEMVNGGVHSKYVEYMMGHSENKNDRHYFKPTNEDLWDNFKKGITRLTIYDENKHLEKIKQLETKDKEHHSLEIDFADMQRELFRLKQENEENKKNDDETKIIVKRIIDEGLIDKLKDL